MRLAGFCEAPGDFRLVAGLVDRVLRELGPTWIADNFESPEVIRTWQPDGLGRAYFDIAHLPPVDTYRVTVWDYTFMQSDGDRR